MVERIRIDDLANKELEVLLKDIDGTKRGIASEALRKGINQMREEYNIESNSEKNNTE